MRTRLIILAPVLIIAALLFSACAKKTPKNPGSSPDGKASGQSSLPDGSTGSRAGSPEEAFAIEIRKGNEVYLKTGCSSCHKIGDEGGGFGPDLTKVASRRTADEIRVYITNPKSVNPEAKMPAQALAEDDLNVLLKYLETLK